MSQDIFVIIEHLRGQVADISYVMLAAARVMAQTSGGKVIAVLLGSGAQGLAKDLAADQVWYVDHPALAHYSSEAYQRVLEGLIRDNAPRAALLGDTSIGSEVGPWLSARLAVPLVSYCRSVTADGKFVSQIFGGKLMAEGDLPGPTVLVMMVPGGFKPEQGKTTQLPAVTAVAAPALEGLRMMVKEYVEPAAGDVDITKEPILIGVGRGIQNQDNIELAQELAQALGGVVCASRPVVDQGWLPTTRLVGKSGKTIKPKLYIALGVSGAPEHVEGVADCEMFIAINTDPNAPIFDIAKYGSQIDMFDLLPVLTEQVQQAKGG